MNFDKIVEKEAKKLDKLSVANFSNLECYKKENIKEFNELAEATDYLKNHVDKETVLIFNPILKAHFPDLEYLFKKNVVSYDLPRWFLATIVPQLDVDFKSFLTHEQKSFYNLDINFERIVAITWKRLKKIKKE